jgi:hypothetical protein
MKFDEYLKEEYFTFLGEYVTICEAVMLSEMSNKTFEEIRQAAKKLGLRVNRSDSIFDFLKDVGKTTADFFRSAVLYASTDITDKKTKQGFVSDMKVSLGRINKKEMTAFLLILDKSTLGLTSHIRHILQGLFGIEVTGYYQMYQQHKQNIVNMRRELKTLKTHMTSRDATPDDMKILAHFKNLIDNLEEEGVG